MDRSSGSVGVLSRIRMDNLLREIILFKQEHNEELTFQSTNSRHDYILQTIPTAKNTQAFQTKGKRNKWIEPFLSKIVANGKVDDGFECIVGYMLLQHEESTRKVLSSKLLLH